MRPALAQLVVLVGFGLTACQSPAPTGRTIAALPTEADERARAAGFTATEVVGARSIYVSKCARCHKFYDPTEYADAEWHTWMNKMSKKARLRPDQAELLARYLAAYRAGSPPADKKP